MAKRKPFEEFVKNKWANDVKTIVHRYIRTNVPIDLQCALAGYTNRVDYYANSMRCSVKLVYRNGFTVCELYFPRAVDMKGNKIEVRGLGASFKSKEDRFDPTKGVFFSFLRALGNCLTANYPEYLGKALPERYLRRNTPIEKTIEMYI